MTTKPIGTIVVQPGVFVDVHEKIAVDYLATKIGYDVTFLAQIETPDIDMNGLHWEIKSPTGKSSRTIENNLRLSMKQSPNIVLNLRRMDGRIPTKKLLNEAERRFTDAKSITHDCYYPARGSS
jgi:hypothetical protein